MKLKMNDRHLILAITIFAIVCFYGCWTGYDQKNPGPDNTFIVSKESKWGLINEKGDEIIPLAYDTAYTYEGSIVVKSGNKYGWYLTTGQCGQKASLDSLNKIGNYFLCYSQEKAFLKSNTGEVAFAEQYTDFRGTYNPNLVLVRNNQKEWGCLSLKDSKLTIPCNHVGIEVYPEGLFLFSRFYKTKFVDYDGREIQIPKEMVDKYANDVDFSSIGSPIKKDKLAMVISMNNVQYIQDQNGRAGIAKNNQIVVPMVFESVEAAGDHNEYCIVKRMGKIGLVKMGKPGFVFNCKYKMIEITSDFLVLTTHDGKQDVRNLKTGHQYKFD